MKSSNRTKAQIVRNVAELRRRLEFLEAAEAKRMRVEEALRESKERFRNLVETIKDWIWEVDLRGVYTYVSPRVRDMLGYEPKELLGKTPFDTMPPQEAARMRKIFEGILKTQKSFDPIENICLHKDGHPAILETSGVPFFAADGTLMGYRGVDRDITERKRTEEALRKREKEYRSVIENIQDVFYRSDLNGRLIMGSPSGAKMFGYDSLEEMIGMPLDSFWPDPKERDRLLAQIKASGNVRDYEAVIKRKDGTTFHASFTTHFYYDDRGNLLGTEGIIRDITERKKTEKALLCTQFAVDRARDAVHWVGPNGELVYVNEAICQMLGYTKEELLSMTVFDIDPQFPKETWREHWQKTRSLGSCVIETMHKTKGGVTFPVEIAINFMNFAGMEIHCAYARDITERKRGEEALRKSEEEAKRLARENAIMAEIGKIISSTLNIEEVYERFAAEVRKLIPFDRISISAKELGEQKVKIVYNLGLDVPKRRTGSSFPLANSFMGEVIRTRSSLLVNPEAMEELTNRFAGYLPAYQAGLRALISVPLFSRDELVGVMNLSSTGQIPYAERELRLAEKVGNQISGAIANALIFAELKRVEEELRMAQSALETRVRERTAELVKTNEQLQTEIIERKNAEESLKRAKEGAEAASIAKSAFLANMSHELRTPLNSIIGFSELMADGQAGELNETQKEYLGDVLQSSRHLLSLINDVLDLAKVEAGKLRLEVGEVYLPALLQNSLALFEEKSMRQGIQVRMEINGIPEWIRGDQQKLEQILYNLLSNALKFTPDGGRVTLDACRLFFEDRQWTRADGGGESIPFSPSIAGEWVGIFIRDTGIGLKKEDLARIFNPFEQADNSTSRRYQGTGLGLALVQKFVELHGGKIWAESQGPGKGSAFRFLIPISQVKGEDARS